MTNFDGIVKALKEGRERLDLANMALTSLNGAGPKTPSRRTMSAAARAQRARWAKQRSIAQTEPVAVSEIETLNTTVAGQAFH